MGLFGSNNDDTRAKIEELKAKMQGGQGAPQQQAWQGQPQQAPEGWQPPRQQEQPQQQAVQAPVQQSAKPQPTTVQTTSHSHSEILLDLGDGMSLNLPIREKMELAEFLRIADRVRELKKIDHH